jgi:hypothetical protein
MSSTNRGGQREASDYYVTPTDQIELFLREFSEKEPSAFMQDKSIFDSCAGGDPKNRGMSYPDAIKRAFNMLVSTMDIRPDSSAEIVGDYLKSRLWPSSSGPAIIITNPPFALALPIIEKALAEAQEWVIMLLRLNFFEGKARKAFWDKHRPLYAFVHSKRMSFTGGKTDSVAYMHCCWKVDFQPEFTKLKVI